MQCFRHVVGLFSFLLLLNACSTVDAFHSTSGDYKNYIQSKLLEKRLYDRGRLLITAKVLAATPELQVQQEKYTPGFSFPYDANKTQLILALSLASDEVFRKNSLRVFLGNREMKELKEEQQRPLIETLYPFAYPFHRILYLDFGPVAMTGVQTLKILTPNGPLETEIEL